MCRRGIPGCADLRLAVVSPFVDRRHGTERALAELLERLACKEHCEVHLYSQRVEDLSLDRYTGRAGDSPFGIIWHKVPSLPGPHLLQFLSWFIANRICRAWDRAFRGLRFDLLLSPGVNCFDADVILVHALFHRLRELAREDLGADQPGFFRRLHRRAYYSFLTSMENRIYANARVSLAAVSQRTAALLRRYFQREDVRVIPNGVDTRQFSPAKRLAFRRELRSQRKFLESDFVLLLIGNDWGTKGFPAILAAMAANRELPLRLLVAGQDPMAPSFLGAAGRLGLGEHCHWQTASADALGLYAVADAYVSPSREDSFGLPVLEAMACGLPVITSVFAGVSQIVTDGVDGFVLSDPRDSTALANLLRRLSQQRDLCQQIGENAARTAQAYTWERHASETWDFLKEAAGNKVRRTSQT